MSRQLATGASVVPFQLHDRITLRSVKFISRRTLQLWSRLLRGIQFRLDMAGIVAVIFEMWRFGP